MRSHTGVGDSMPVPLPTSSRVTSRVFALGGSAAAAVVVLVAVGVYWRQSSAAKDGSADRAASNAARRQEVQVHGFRNIGNTCFLNCILQALASLPSFTLYLEHLHAYVQSAEASTLPRSPPTSAPSNPSFAARLSSYLAVPSRPFLSQPPSSSELVRHFLLIQSGNQRDPSPLYRLLTREAVQFRGFRQQDAHELLLAILDLLDKRLGKVQLMRARAIDGSEGKPQLVEEAKEVLKDGAPALPTPTDPFVGSTSQFLVCLTCSYSSPPSRTSFNTLTLPLPQLPYYALQAPVALHSCVNEYTSNERVDGVRCAMCGAAETRTACVRQMTLMAHSDREWTDKRCERYQRLAGQCGAMEQRMQKLDPALASKLLSNAVQAPSSPPAEVLAYVNGNTVDTSTGPALTEHQVPRTCIKKILLSQLPKVLCIHLNRLCGDRKLSTRVLFDRHLDLSHFTPNLRARDAAAVDRPSGSASDSGYRLCSVVCHHGGAVGGHYTCYRQHDRYQAQADDGLAGSRDDQTDTAAAAGKDAAEERKEEAGEETKEDAEGHQVSEERKEAGLVREASVVGSQRAVDRVWVHVSDDEVRRVSWREVANCEAYMLFYEKET